MVSSRQCPFVRGEGPIFSAATQVGDQLKIHRPTFPQIRVAHFQSAYNGPLVFLTQPPVKMAYGLAEYGIDPRRPEDALRILAEAEARSG